MLQHTTIVALAETPRGSVLTANRGPFADKQGWAASRRWRN
jgi:hypothetical protein